MKPSARFFLWRKAVGREEAAELEEKIRARTSDAVAVIERPGLARVAVEVCSSSRGAVERLAAEFGGRIELLPRDWLERIGREQRRAPLRIGGRLLVRQERSRQRLKGRESGELVIPAAGAFGTGEHATTAMCLRLLERLTRGRERWSLLDAGTGTGILALAAHRFGARKIVAIDADKQAVATARENARVNGIGGVQFRVADALTFKAGAKFDFVTANLYSELLMAALPNFSRQLKQDGRLIFSGILREQEDEVVRALRRAGFVATEIRRRGKWVALMARRVAQKAS